MGYPLQILGKKSHLTVNPSNQICSNSDRSEDFLVKFRLSEKHTNFEKNPPYGFDVYLVNQLICQNHKEDFLKSKLYTEKMASEVARYCKYTSFHCGGRWYGWILKKEERTFKPNLPVCKIARSMIVYWVENGFCVIDQCERRIWNLDILNRFISDLQQNKNHDSFFLLKK